MKELCKFNKFYYGDTFKIHSSLIENIEGIEKFIVSSTDAFFNDLNKKLNLFYLKATPISKWKGRFKDKFDTFSFTYEVPSNYPKDIKVSKEVQFDGEAFQFFLDSRGISFLNSEVDILMYFDHETGITFLFFRVEGVLSFMIADQYIGELGRKPKIEDRIECYKNLPTKVLLDEIIARGEIGFVKNYTNYPKNDSNGETDEGL